ncbi:MAG: nitroreductase [Bacteroidetes bacterium]|nr:nitroreductase [Bacteroidota bacterium]
MNNNISEIIKNRRSVFTNQFSGEKVPEEIIEEMLENANWAPTHMHTEPWRFQVFENQSADRLMDELARIYKLRTPVESFSQAKMDKYQLRKNQISHAIVIILHKSLRPDLPEIEEVAATAAAVQNLWLTLASYPGYGGYWSTGHLVYTDEFRQFLKLHENQLCMGIFYIGKIKTDTPHTPGKRDDWNNKVTWIL